MAPTLLFAFGAVLAVAGPILAWTKTIQVDMAIGVEIAAVCALLSGWITLHVHMATRDRVLAIYLMGIFVVFYWAAGEQAGNALNLWADQTTNRYLTATPPPVPAPPEEQAKADAGWLTFLNPVPTAWFQSINPLAIFILAPVLAWLWVRMERKGYGTSIPTKISIGVLLMSAAFIFMVLAAQYENGESSVPLPLSKLPPGIEEVDGKLRPASEGGEKELFFQAGRLIFDPKTKTLSTRGVLPDTERDRIVRDSAPASFKQIATILAKLTPELPKDTPGDVEVEVGKLSINPTEWLPDAKASYDAKAGKLKVRARCR